MPNAKQFETSSLGNCLVSELFQQFASSRKQAGMVMEITFLRILWRCLSKEDFDALATGEEEANIGVSLSAWSANIGVSLSAWSAVELLKAGVRKFRALFDFTTCSLVANCYYVHAVAI